MRKRPYQAPGDKSELSSALRQIGDSVQRGRHAVGLAKADAVLGGAGLSKIERARVVAMVADSEFKRGRFDEAAQIQLRVAADTIEDPTLWLRAYIGEVLALLKSPNAEDALMMARHAVEVAETKMVDFDEKVRLAKQAVEDGGTVEVPPVPVRVSVVATRMGYLFLQEGEPEAAEEFFNRAIESTKGGANKARQGLAKIALARGEFGKAINMASDAIRRGGYKVKTLDAWKTLISARRQLCGWKIRERLIAGLDTVPAGLRARTILTIVRELRKNDMRQWRDVAENWSKKEGRHFPVIETEIRKMALASAKAEPGNATDKREKAEQLLQMPNLSAKEWLNGTKEFVRASLWEGSAVDFGQLIASAVLAYGEEFGPRARHSLALSCMMAKRHDLARPLLQENIQMDPYGNPMWAKSVWALARMEGLLGDHAASAVLYRQFADEDSISNKFRLQAQLNWCQELIAAGEPGPLLEARALMEATLAGVSDPDVLMNFARQLQLGPDELREWSTELYSRGKTVIIQNFNAENNPAIAAKAIFRLTRRQIYDFNRPAEVVQFWEDMSPVKKVWLWSTLNDYWEYMGLILDAYIRTRTEQEAEHFASALLDDPSTPSAGIVYVGIPYGQWLLRRGRIQDAEVLLDRCVDAAPSHQLCAYVYYRKALIAFNQGKTYSTEKYVGNMRRVQKGRLGILSEWDMNAKAELLLHNLNIESASVCITWCPDDMRLHYLRAAIIRELGMLS